MRPAPHTTFVVRAIALVAMLLSGADARAAELDPAWLGAWIGEAASPAANAARPIATNIIVRRAGAAGPEARYDVLVTSIVLGAVDRAATDIVADGASLAFTLPVGARKLRFEAELAEPRTSAKGSFTIVEAADGNQRSRPWSLRRTELPREIATARTYTATLDAAGQKIPMRLALAEGPLGWCATLDIAPQGLKDFLLATERTATGFRLTLASGEDAIIELASSADMKSLEGTFAQGAFKGPIRFELANASAAARRRPQDPAPNAPYTSIGVRIAHPAGHVLAGTLSIPLEKRLARSERFPAVVLVSGSGPQDRKSVV